MEHLKLNVMKKCTICGALSSGVHFGVHACNSCTSFFRRYHIKKESQVLPCLFGELCPINGSTVSTRSYCKACRLAKCLTVGMAETGAWRGRSASRPAHHPQVPPAPLQISGAGRATGENGSSGTVSGAASTSSSVSSGSRGPSELSPPPSPASTSSVSAVVKPAGAPQYACVGPLYTPGPYALPPGSTAIWVPVPQGNQRVEPPKFVTGQGQVLTLSSSSPVVSGYPALSNALWGPRKSVVPAAHITEPKCQASGAKVMPGISQEQPLDLSVKRDATSNGQKFKTSKSQASESRGAADAAKESGFRESSHGHGAKGSAK